MRRYRKQAGSSVGRRAQRGAVAMGMMAQSGRRSAFRRQTGDEVAGCIDPMAINYNPNANVSESGACEYNFGCTDPSAQNYDSNATFDDGSCQPLGCEISIAQGCTNPEALNYEAWAEVDDGSCVTMQDVCMLCAQTGVVSAVDGPKPTINVPSMAFRKQTGGQVAGCTSPMATNYYPNATTDDGSCIFHEGCTIQSALNYDPNAVISNASCTFSEVISCFPMGCTDPDALNFDEGAMLDDGSCILFQDYCSSCGTLTGGNDPVGPVSATDGIKQTINRPSMAFRKQAGDIPTCTMAGHALPDGAETMLNPELSGCGVCRCQIPDGADCPDRIGQWMGGSIFNVDPSSCNCNFQSAGCVNPTGGGLLDPSLSNPSLSKLPRLRGKMRNQAGKTSRATQTGSGHTMRCGTPLGAMSYHGWEHPEPTWGFTGCDYLFGTQSECQAQCTSGPSPQRDKMRNASGRDMCGFYSNSSDAPFTG